MATAASSLNGKNNIENGNDRPTISSRINNGTNSEDDEDDVPLSIRIDKKVKVESAPVGSFAAALLHSPKSKNASISSPPKLSMIKPEEDSDDDVPLAIRKSRLNGDGKTIAIKKRKETLKSDDGSDDDFSPVPKKKERISMKEETITTKNREKHKTKSTKSTVVEQETVSSKGGRRKKMVKVEEEEVWKWWEEDKHADGVKWKTLEHHGPIFAPAYEPLPDNVNFKYDGHVMKLTAATEEVASFYAKMLDHDYVTKDVFNQNFFKDWRKVMTASEREKIVSLSACDFREMAAYYQVLSEQRRNMSKEEKLKIKEEREAEMKIYGYAIIDGHKQKIGNYRIEPPGLFRGRGTHPKMGKLKRRVNPDDVIINCSKKSKIPVAPPGHRWKEVRHDNTVSWLCAWTENVLGQNKYIMLNPSSKIKGEKDWEKFETARKLKTRVDHIREKYTEDFKSKEMKIRQRAVALYFIDQLALRAGNEKDSDEVADTVGCCSLRCEHITLSKAGDSKDKERYTVTFDFLGKDSIEYKNTVDVERRVFKNLQLFMENKSPKDDLFDRLDTTILNEHLKSLMPGLTAKVFRTFNASNTLQKQLDLLTKEKDSIHDKLLSYNRANREVAVLCNHQRSAPKTFEKTMENLSKKIKEKKSELKTAKSELDKCRGEAARVKARKKVERIKEQLKRMKIQHTDRDENKLISLGTSKLNYLDPRISVAWCKKNNVPIEKVYNKTQREKFRWAIDMTDESFVF